jgi:hypothetical protein
MSTTITPTEQNIDINVTNDVIDINVTNEIVDVNATTQQIDINVAGAYPLPNSVLSVFGRVGNIVATEGDYTLTQLGDVTLSSPSNGQVLKYNGTAWVNGTDAGGITTLNTLTALTQTFATGTSGTDFNISSATSTHTFNLPTASAINRGLLSSTDWATFNNKQDTITNPVTGTGTTNTIPLWNATSNITNSVITQVSGNIRVGSTTQTSKLNVGGDIDLSGVLKNNGTQIINVGSGSLALGDGTGKLTTSDIIVNTSPFTITIGSSFVPYAFTNYGSVTGNSFIKIGGTSSQFLKADGSVDSTAYGTGTVTSVAALTIGTSGTDLSSTVANSTTTPVITLNVPTASATNRGALSSADWTTFNSKQNALTNPITGTGTSGQVAYFNGTTSLTSSATFAFTPTSQLLVNNSVTAASQLARGTNLNSTLIAAANNDILVGLDINPTFTNGAFTGVSNFGLRVNGNIASTSGNNQVIFTSVSATTGWQILRMNSSGASLNFGIEQSAGASRFGNTLGYSSVFGTTNATALHFATNNLTRATIFSNGNFLIAPGIQTDAGFRLDVNGTARVQGATTISTGDLTVSTGTTISSAGFRLAVDLNADLGTSSIRFFRSYIDTMNTRLVTTSGTVTAASAIARGVYIVNNLTAAANNDVLVGLDINPTFTLGAFTGLGYYPLRVSGIVSLFNSTGATQIRIIGPSGSNKSLFFGNTTGFNDFQNVRLYNQGTTNLFVIATGDGTANPTDRFFITQGGNVGINTSGTDAGFRLDVNGTARVQSTLTIGTTAIISTEQAIISSNTAQQLRLYNSASAIGTQAQLTFTTNTFGAVSSAIAAVSLDNLGNQTLSFLTSNAGTVAERLRIWNTGNVHIQNGGTYTDVASSILTMNSTTKGFLPPRMTTTQKNAISSPATGLQVYDTTLNQMSYYNGTTWTNI